MIIMESSFDSCYFLLYLFIQIVAYINWFCLIPNEFKELWISFSKKKNYWFLRIHKIFEGFFFSVYFCFDAMKFWGIIWMELHIYEIHFFHGLVVWSIKQLFVDYFSVELYSWSLLDLEKFCIWWSNSDWSLEDFSLITATACFRYFILGLFISLNV